LVCCFREHVERIGRDSKVGRNSKGAYESISVTILLGLTVGASTQATTFLTGQSIKVFAIGALSFVIATIAGILFVKIFNLFLSKDNKINPLIGNAGVSAVPDSARISQVVGLEYDPSNYLLMHAMGPNVAGVIGSAVAAGIMLGFLY